MHGQLCELLALFLLGELANNCPFKKNTYNVACKYKKTPYQGHTENTRYRHIQMHTRCLQYMRREVNTVVRTDRHFSHCRYLLWRRNLETGKWRIKENSLQDDKEYALDI